MRTLRLLLAQLLLATLLATGACDCGDGDGDGDGDGGGVDADTPDADGTDTGTPCEGAGGACTVDGDCCSGDCTDSMCVGGCTNNGDACAADGDCCSGNCDADVCAPAAGCTAVGNPCSGAADCCSGACNTAGGDPCAGGGDCVCAPPPACKGQTEACGADAECCNDLCVDGACADLAACDTAGEPCSSEGLSGSCCSTVCLDQGEGPRCQFLGGCRVQDDLCTSDAQCCSGACNVRETTADGREVRRCANVESCLPAGEVCGEGGSSSNCCPNGGGDTGCEPTGTGFRRCFGGDGTCTLPGRPCTETSECCMETFPAIMCSPGPSGDNICCLADGEECAFGDVCCSGICTPDPTDGVLRCGDMCIPDGNPCTVDADCCGCACIEDSTGAQVCTSNPDLCDPCTGPSLGEACDPAGEPCCDGTCGGSGEFSTCVITG